VGCQRADIFCLCNVDYILCDAFDEIGYLLQTPRNHNKVHVKAGTFRILTHCIAEFSSKSRALWASGSIWQRSFSARTLSILEKISKASERDLSTSSNRAFSPFSSSKVLSEINARARPAIFTA